MRKDIIKIVNAIAEKGTLDFDLFKCYDLILNYCKDNHIKPSKNSYDLNFGILTINGINAGRVDHLPKKVQFDEYSYYMEGKILARQEIE